MKEAVASEHKGEGREVMLIMRFHDPESLSTQKQINHPPEGKEHTAVKM